MGNPMQAALSIVGAGIGFLIGGPAGAAWGFQLGGLAGSALFPTDLGTVNGPRLNDLSVQSSAVGAPIPIIYGRFQLAGNVIWSSGIIETVTKRRYGGKGGPSQTVKEYSYSVNVAVGVCEGPILGISRIWADAKLIYDVRPRLEGETMEELAARLLESWREALASKGDEGPGGAWSLQIYSGTEDQLADPTIESFEGAGNVSAFRGLAYVVFSEFQLADYGNRVPNFRFEVWRQPQGGGFVTCETVEAVSRGVIPEWNLEGSDPRSAGYEYSYNLTYGVDGVDMSGGYTTDVTAVLSAMEAEVGRPFVDHVYQWTSAEVMYDVDWFRDPAYPCAEAIGTGAVNRMSLDLYINSVADFPSVCLGESETLGSAVDIGDPARHYAPGSDLNPFSPQIRVIVGWDAPNTIGGVTVTDTIIGTGTWDGSQWSHKVLQMVDKVIKVRRFEQAPPSWIAGYPESDLEGYHEVGDTLVREVSGWTWDPDIAVRGLRFASYTGLAPNDYLIDRPLGPFLTIDDDRYFNQAWWEAAYTEAVTAGDMEPGLVYGVDYPAYGIGAYRATYEVCSVGTAPSEEPVPLTIGQVVADICERCGLETDQVDVLELQQPLTGYAITRVMSGRDAISPLRAVGAFDCVESAGVLKWPKRGNPIVASLTADDLGAHEAGGQRPAAMQVTRTQEVELPRRLRVHYINQDTEGEPGEQSASRLSVGTDQVQDVELAVAMSDTRAARIAEVLLYDAWVSRNRYETTVDQSFLALEPADAIEAPVDGRMERLRIVDVDHSLPGLLRLALVRDDDGVYESYAIGAPAAYESPTQSNLQVPGTADLVLLDLPMLRDTDNDAGYYAAVRSVGGNTWQGAVVYRTADEWATYDQVATLTQQGTIGELADALPAGPTTVIDEGNELLVDGLATDALESVSEASLLTGRNSAAIGDDGRWEIIQFRDAELTGSPPVWRLTGLLRGRRGTEWAMGLSQVGDRFVLLDAAIARVPLNVSTIGAARPHEAVMVGRTLTGTTAVAFTGRGVALEPFAPVHVEGERDEAGDLTISWVRRDRLGQELPANTDIPMSEASESYEVDILSTDSPPEVLRTLTASTPSVTYTEAQQAEDFGSPVPDTVTVRIYQLSATVGRGYAAEATV